MLIKKMNKASLIEATEWLGLIAFMAVLMSVVWKVGSSVTCFTLLLVSLAAIVTLLGSSLVLMNKQSSG